MCPFKLPFIVLFSTLLSLSFLANAQKKRQERKGELYFSWGYNKEWYTTSNVQVDQPELGNHYAFNHISGHDHPGWDQGVLDQPVSIPQYNYRLGYIFNRKKGLGIEINFDHTKFIFEDQNARISGVMNNKPIDSTVAFNSDNGFYYYLNNGANFLLFNFIKRWDIYASRDEKLKIDFLGKAGIGPVIPHVENSFFGQANQPHFQFGGWNMGVEAALRVSFFRYVYLEYASKYDYARYAGLQIYKGNAKQSFGTYEMILSLGFNFPVGKRQAE